MQDISGMTDEYLLAKLVLAKANINKYSSDRHFDPQLLAQEKKLKLQLKTEAAARGILPPDDSGDDQNFSQPEAEVIEMQKADPLTGGAMPDGPSTLGDLSHVSETAAVVNG